ncbi:MAG: HAMP domain-containing protein [Gammaproteobacteria bacterium]|nr:HAMP domain-containing protein [Gammaproteobacteria bacterium]
MARLRLPYTAAIVAAVLGLHALMLPVLYARLARVIRTNEEDTFVDDVRTYARETADQLELQGVHPSVDQVQALLDTAIVNGGGVFAEYDDGRNRIRSTLGRRGLVMPRTDTFRFEREGSGIYFITMPVNRQRGIGELRFGFDERPTLRHERVALERMRTILLLYTLVSVLIASFLGLWLSRPIGRLRSASRRIAAGDATHRLRVRTRIEELRGLAADLARMRRRLVGANRRLRREMQAKEAALASRRELESDLRHRQRLATVGTLAGGIAHEFNNALLPVILFTESALADTAADSVVHGDLERVLASARRARELVQKILVFSRKAGAGHPVPTDLREVVAEAMRLFMPISPSTLEVRVFCTDPVGRVRVDPALIVQLIMNLCVNAYQAIGERSGEVQVGVRAAAATGDLPRTLPPGRYVELWVRDDGCGMSPETVERIFEPFFTTRPVGSGTGLGLSVVHGIAESFGARIVVESRLGAGSTFRVFFAEVLEADRGDRSGAADVEVPCRK